jgi:hypothetical protein
MSSAYSPAELMTMFSSAYLAVLIMVRPLDVRPRKTLSFGQRQ